MHAIHSRAHQQRPLACDIYQGHMESRDLVFGIGYKKTISEDSRQTEPFCSQLKQLFKETRLEIKFNLVDFLHLKFRIN